MRLSNHTATMTALPAAIVSSAREDRGECSSTTADDNCAHPAIANANASVVEMSACRGTIPKWITAAPAAMAASSVVMSCCGARGSRFDHRLSGDAEHQREISRRRVILRKSAVG